ncbi:MAG: type II secretion system F family protein [Xanthobacteraceae bacterium]
MNEPWVIYFLVFAGAVLGVEAVYFFLVRPHRSIKAIDRRLAAGEQLPILAQLDDGDLRREGGLLARSGNSILRKVGTRLRQTGLQLNLGFLLLWTAGLAVFFFVILGFAVGYGFVSLIIAAVAAIGSAVAYLELIRSRRIARFEEQLPDAIDIIVRGVRAGHPFSSAIALAGQEMPVPTGVEFAMAADELAYGRDMTTALDNLHRRVGETDLVFLIVSLSIQERTGGNLLDILSRLSALIRRRLLFRQKVGALTAEGRLSALVLTLMPFVLLAVMVIEAPDYLATIRGHPIAMPAAVAGLLALLVGNLIIHRMVRFKI